MMPSENMVSTSPGQIFVEIKQPEEEKEEIGISTTLSQVEDTKESADI
jgi:hypothetical protein